MKVIIGAADEFRHTVEPPEIVAVGRGFTVTVACPVCSWLQAWAVPSVTLIRLYVNAAATVVGTATVTLLPKTVVTVLFEPLLILYVKV